MDIASFEVISNLNLANLWHYARPPTKLKLIYFAKN
jgi:hypothetical protein